MTVDIIFLHFSYLLTLLALSIRGIFWLRIVLTISQFGHLINAYMNDDVNKSGFIKALDLIKTEIDEKKLFATGADSTSVVNIRFQYADQLIKKYFTG